MTEETIDASTIQHLNLQICNTIKDAPNYKDEEPERKTVNLTKAVVVRNGTVEDRSTVDLQFEDAEGNKFVAMTTGRLLKMISHAIGDE